MAITLADFNKIWASTSPLTPYSFSESNYKQGWNFIGSTPPARQMWDFLQKNNDEKMQYLANNYLPLTGGTMSGAITQTSGLLAKRNVDNNELVVCGGTDATKGAYLSLVGKDSGSAGAFRLAANNGSASRILNGTASGSLQWDGHTVITDGQTATGTNLNIGFAVSGDNEGSSLGLRSKSYGGNSGGFVLTTRANSVIKELVGRPDGTLTWNGQPIQTSSDKRLKQDFSDVPAEVLEAWGKINWQQFKYIDDAERKGVNRCRWHTGLVAQDVKEVGEENDVDLLKYGILCHDVREAVEEEKDENGNVIKEASEAVDLWTVRYEEALAMEVIYLRNEIKKLREEISKLK